MACIAVDIGASSGRLIAGWIENSLLKTKEIYRFSNGMTERGGHLFWDIDRLYEEIMTGISMAEMSFESIGVDTWGVDYALLDEKGRLVSDVYAYRDHRTDGIANTVDQEWIYSRTGIQMAPFNTLYQLMAHEDKRGARFLTVPDYLHYRLSGQSACEYTIATTTQLLNIETGKWDDELIGMTGFNRSIFPEIVPPGTHIGNMLERPGVKVIVPAAHDTGSAVAAVPADGTNFAYISSGTWSLMGIESASAQLKNKSFTNEGGVSGTYRILKNIMGLWMIQEVRRLLPEKYSFAELAELAETPFGSTVDVNDLRFLSPDNMIDEICLACRENQMPVPESPGELARCIFDSLAESYRQTLGELREFACVDKLHIVSGGCQNKLLNRLCQTATGCDVFAGPVEATAIGNILMQMITLGEVKSLSEGRSLIRESFGVEKY